MKKILFYLYLTCIILFVGGYLPAGNGSFITKDFFRTSINWTEGNISILVRESLSRVVVDPADPDYGKNYTSYNISDARNKSILRARDKASIRTISAIERIQLDDKHTILDKLDADEKFREYFNQFYLLEPDRLNIRFQKDNVILEERINLLGRNGVMNYIQLPFDSEKFPEFEQEKYPVPYTGLIIDARHLKAKPVLLPRIVTDAGLEIYSPYLVSKYYAIDRGMVAYLQDPMKAMKHRRVGDKPFFTIASDTYGENQTGYTIATEDAIRLLSASSTRKNLKRCRVIILLSEPPF